MTANTPLVSIVVISYNQAQYIKQNLDHLKAQTYTNWELIVADDASKDNSVDVFKKWLVENKVEAKEIYHLQNTGLATVLNEATELCNGKYIKFIAADDYLHPSCLEKSVQCLEEKGENYGMVFTDTFCVDENSMIQKDMANYNELGLVDKEVFRKDLLKSNRIAALTVLMHKNVLIQTGKYDNHFLAEDYFRWLKIAEKYYICYIPEKLAYYRTHGSNLSIKQTERLKMEDLVLKMRFDHEGIHRKFINSKIQEYYLSKKLTYLIKTTYYQYQYSSHRLKFALKFNLPRTIYKEFCKYF